MTRRDAIKSTVLGAVAVGLGLPVAAKSLPPVPVNPARWHEYWSLTTFGPGSCMVLFYNDLESARCASRAIAGPQRKPPVIEHLVFYGKGLHHPAEKIKMTRIKP